MKRAKILTFVKFCCISLYGPIAVALIPIFLFSLLGLLSYSFNGCMDFSACYLEPVTSTLIAPKTWKLMLFLWVIGIICVVTYTNCQRIWPVLLKIYGRFK